MFAGEIVQNGEPTIGIRDKDGDPWLQLGNVVDPSIRPEPIGGIHWWAEVTPPPYVDGTIAFLQLANCFRQYVFADDSHYVQWSQGQYCLDGSFPYGNIKSVHDTLSDNDTPGIGLENSEEGVYPIFAASHDQFQTYLIYHPSGTDSIWVTLSMLTWSWNGVAQKQLDGTWTLLPFFCNYDASSSYSTSVLPEWNGRSQDIPFIPWEELV